MRKGHVPFKEQRVKTKSKAKKSVKKVAKKAMVKRKVVKASSAPSKAPAKAPVKKDFEAFSLNQDRPIIFVNDRWLAKRDAMVSVYDHGLLYGDGVFEGIRIYNNKIFKLEQHMDRLYRSAERIRLTIPVTRDRMIEIQRQAIKKNKIKDGYIRLLVTRGVGALGLNPFKCPKAGIICIADQIRLYPPEMYDSGMKVVIAKRPRVPVSCLDPRIKSLNYLNNILAKVEALDAGCLEAIMLNTDGFVAECTGDNIFVIKDGAVFTPPSEAGVLEGVTRRFVMNELCPRLGITCQEKWMKIEDVLAADEVFLTGSAAEIIAVTSIDGQTVGAGGEGTLTNKLRMLFRQIVTSNEIPED